MPSVSEGEAMQKIIFAVFFRYPPEIYKIHRPQKQTTFSKIQLPLEKKPCEHAYTFKLSAKPTVFSIDCQRGYMKGKCISSFD
ncbi:hypothetical protein ACFL1G_02810 [Planctomycetota bacterium]